MEATFEDANEQSWGPKKKKGSIFKHATPRSVLRRSPDNDKRRTGVNVDQRLQAVVNIKCKLPVERSWSKQCHNCLAAVRDLFASSRYRRRCKTKKKRVKDRSYTWSRSRKILQRSIITPYDCWENCRRSLSARRNEIGKKTGMAWNGTKRAVLYSDINCPDARLLRSREETRAKRTGNEYRSHVPHLQRISF